VMNGTLQNPFPENMDGAASLWSNTIGTLGAPNNFAIMDVTVPSPNSSTYLNAEYLCRFSYPMTWAQASVNVMVATLSIFTTGWTLSMWVISFFVKRTPDAEFCAGHTEIKSRIPNEGSERDRFDMPIALLANSGGRESGELGYTAEKSIPDRDLSFKASSV